MKNLLDRISILEKQLNTAHADIRKAKKRIRELEEWKINTKADMQARIEYDEEANNKGFF